ncbi:ABC transporter permease [Cohnella cellulosilytica]|uniref:ABC transporter permease n=1 Tax=Cohnella cellulosilytica TaxID=986710 RepID=A0ABW2F2S1_9BACL
MPKFGKSRENPLHLMLLPSVVLVLIYSYLPMVGLFIAFQKFNPAHLFDSPWIGLDNFQYVYYLPGSMQILWNTLTISLFKIIGLIVVPVTFALLLNEVGKSLFKRTFQTLIYLPNFLSWIIMAGVLIDILSPSEGIVNNALGLLGIEPIFFLGDPGWFPVTMVVSDVWKGFGFGTVIYLAALTSIDPALYESARVDGAGRWKQTLHITLPGITPIIVLMSVLSLGNVLNAGFDQIFNLYSPQVYETGDIIDTFVYRLGIEQTQFSPATAVGLFKSVISFSLIALSYYLASKFADYRIF